VFSVAFFRDHRHSLKTIKTNNFLKGVPANKTMEGFHPPLKAQQKERSFIMRYTPLNHFTGELLGTFILVFFGCGSVAVTVLFSAHVGLLQVGMIWGIGVTLAIYATRHLSCAHLNPAVSLAMVVGKRMSADKLLVYLPAQFIGAFAAAMVLYAIFSSSISQYETAHGIVRGSMESVKTAMMFGELSKPRSAGGGCFNRRRMCGRGCGNSHSGFSDLFTYRRL